MGTDALGIFFDLIFKIELLKVIKKDKNTINTKMIVLYPGLVQFIFNRQRLMENDSSRVDVGLILSIPDLNFDDVIFNAINHSPVLVLMLSLEQCRAVATAYRSGASDSVSDLVTLTSATLVG